MTLPATFRQTSRDTTFWALPLFVFFSILIIFLSNTGDLLFRDPDLFWHITTGRKILETGSFPWTDEFSHTFRGRPWIAKEWLSQIIFAITYSASGWKGLAALIGCAVGLTFSILFFVMSQRVRIVPALIIALFAYSLAAPHFLVRPHMLSFPLIVIWVAGLVHAVETRTRPSFLLLPVMVLWANLHGGFTLGLALIAPLAVEAILSQDPSERMRSAKAWAIFSIAAGFSAFVTPYGYFPLWATYQVFGGNEALNYIIEWQPFNFAKEKYAGPLLILALLVGLLSGFKLPLIRCLVVVGMIYLSLIHVRFVALTAIIVPVLIAGPLAKQFAGVARAKVDPALASLASFAARPGFSIMFAIALVVGAIAAALLPARYPPPNIVPAGAVDFISAQAKTKKIYNDYLFGGYLIFRGIPTFVDGRSDQLFGGGFLTELYRTLRGPNPEFRELLDKYDISLALVRPNSAETQRLDDTDRWRRVYSDDAAVVYERKP